MTRSNVPEKGTTQEQFPGFEPITGNFVYCPNQFFDVCLPHFPRGVVRIVGYVLRRTLGFVDARGQPLAETFQLSYNELIEKAGVGHDAIRDSINKAIEAGFIVCLTDPCPNAKHQSSQSGCYGLRWAELDESYTTNLNAFAGFFSGEGNRTPIPNAFFDHVLCRERLAVVKVVGSVLRHTVGYHTKFGRREEAPLSYSYLQRYANIKSRATLGDAVQRAIEADYILRVQSGSVGPKPEQRRAATYAVKWLAAGASDTTSPKNKPAEHSENCTSETVRKSNQQHSDKQTSSNPKSKPAKHSENRTKEKTTPKDKPKQQHKEGDVVFVRAGKSQLPVEAAELVRQYHRLRFGVGDYDPQPHELKHATALLTSRSIDELASLLPEVVRSVQQNYGGEDVYFGAAVPYFAHASRKQANTQRLRATAHQENKEHQSLAMAEFKQRQERQQRRSSLLAHWEALSESDRQRFRQLAINQATSETVSRRLKRLACLDAPPTEILDVMATEFTIAVGE